MQYVTEGTSLDFLQSFLEEHFQPGEEVGLSLHIGGAVTEDNLAEFEQYCYNHGLELTRPVEFGSEPYPNTVYLQFRRPVVDGKKIGFWPLILLAIGGFAILGFTLWKTSNIIDSITKNMIPIALIAVGGFVLYNWSKQPRRA